MPVQIATFTNAGLVPAYPCDCGACAIELPVALKDGVYAKGTVLDRTTATGGTNEVQTLAITGAPSAVSLTLSYTNPWTGAVETTAALTTGATASAIQAALIALDSFDAGDIVVTGGVLNTSDVVFTFGGRYASRDVGAISVTATFTGGTVPAAAIAETTKGVVAAGTFFAYAGGTARAILRYGCTVILGRITGLGEHGESMAAAPAYFNGTFRTEDTAGLDADALTDLGARLFAGSVTTGIVHIP
jgi:hypothetical protein